MATPRPLPELPRVFGRYVLLRRLSRGGMGEIFLAKLGDIEGFEKLCILKKVLPHLAADRDFITRFIDEAKIAITLAHSNIVTVHEVGMVDGEYFLAMEYVEGRDLRRLMSRCWELRRRVPPEIALYVARELASGLAYAHRKVGSDGRTLGLVHCDVSPPNVLLSYEGGVKVIDFGIAKSTLRLSESNPRIGFGKVGYMAPEQLVRGGLLDRRTDLYASGVLLHELLTGQRLFSFPEGADYRTIARTVAGTDPEPPSRRDPALAPFDGLCLRALARKPEDRFQTGEEMRDEVSRALSHIAPTMSGDRLGEFLRAQFEKERQEDHLRLAEVSRVVHVDQIQEDLEEERTHTVTFALGDQWFVGESRPLEGLAEPPAAPEVAPEIRTAKGRRAAPPLPRLATAGAFVGAIAVGAIIAWAAMRRAPSVVVTPGAGGIAELQPPTTAPAPSPRAPTVARVPIAVVPPTVGVRAVGRWAGGPEAAAERRPLPSHDPGAPSPPALASGSPSGSVPEAAVSAKLAHVTSEYDDFKQAYGPRLDGEWGDIVQLATFGHGAEHFARLDALLERFERRMQAIRGGAASP